VNDGLPDSHSVAALVVDPAVPTTLYCGAGGVWKSIDAGGHWTAAASGFPPDVSVSALAMDRATPTTVYAGTQSSGVFRSTDGGSSWSAFNVGLTNMNVTALAIDPTGTSLHAGTPGGGVLDYQVFVPAPCSPGLTTLCLNDARFSVKADWRVPSEGTGGHGMAVPLSGDTGYFWFFNASNIEMIVKVLDGCGINRHEWVFAGGLTDVEVTLTVTDTQTGEVKTYVNPAGTPFRPIQDTVAFTNCPSSTTSSVLEAGRVAPHSDFPSSKGPAAAPTGLDVRAHEENIESCSADPATLCLSSGRFRVRADWRVPSAGTSGHGTAVSLTGDTGYFWFFGASNVEMIVKVLDGCGLNVHKWVFAGGLTNVEVTLTVTDTQTGAVKTYVNPANTAFLPIQDTAAFGTCP
ncbi:MAG TPA: hypothetical protein VGS00_03645, partial [Thermoanaerobaculia bacterium]|nr:hypothetical protein [Thermoanaerobaculia bacterium]